MDAIDREILMMLQEGIPIAPRPYAVMAEKLDGVDEEEVIHRIARLKEENIIRRMSGFFNSHALGYVSTLAAVRPVDGKEAEAVSAINRYPGVTHNYKRDHEHSIWFTLIAINEPTMAHILNEIAASPYVDSLLRLDMQKRYKIDVTFDLSHKAKENEA